ncbi:MAG: C-terminal binding protein [Desulfovibrio sp.]|nr:C-terminal binding protein [Desulfovibrio sp.]
MLAETGFDVEIRKANETDEDLLTEVLQDADVAVCLGNPPFTRKVIQSLPKLQIIQRCGIGLNSVDLEAATEHGKIVYYVPGYCVYELALHAMGLILANLRNICWYDRNMRQGRWRKGEGPTPRNLSSLTVGLFGFGGSGAILAKMLQNGFETSIITCDPFIAPERAKEAGVRLVDFEMLLRESDIISIHAALTKETKHTFNTSAFKKMKNNAMIVNIARGGLIDIAALTEALQSGEIGFAGLDVFEVEPMPAEHPLYALDNVVLTPHSAYYSEESTFVYKYLSAFLPIEACNHKKLYKKQLANPAILEKFPDFAVESEAPIPPFVKE